MSLESSNMAGSALGMTFSLLLLASVTQGLKDFEMHHYETMEAVVGQNVTLPCTLKGNSNLKLVSIEWTKKNEKDDSTKLGLYSPQHGQNLFTSKVSATIEKSEADKLNGFHLNIPVVKKCDNGIYICDITTFPLGSLRFKTELIVKDVDKIVCDANSTIEVHNGENVTIRCRVFPNTQYKWIKDKNIVSEKESLELWQVTGEHAGIYTLTVNTGNTNLHETFNIIVLTVTTSLRTDSVTASPQSNVTREGLIDSADSNFTTSMPTGLSATDTSVSWTASTGTDVTDTANPNNVTVTAGEYINSFTNDTRISVTSSPATHTDPYHLLNSTMLSSDSTVFSPTQEMASDEMRNESTPHAMNPEDAFTNGPESAFGNSTESFKNPTEKNETQTGLGDKVLDNARSHLLVLIIVPALVLIAVVGFLYRRHIIKQRMDLPPSFKPPPPPVKYAAVRQSEPFPISRCNSVPYI